MVFRSTGKKKQQKKKNTSKRKKLKRSNHDVKKFQGKKRKRPDITWLKNGVGEGRDQANQNQGKNKAAKKQENARSKIRPTEGKDLGGPREKSEPKPSRPGEKGSRRRQGTSSPQLCKNQDPRPGRKGLEMSREGIGENYYSGRI